MPLENQIEFSITYFLYQECSLLVMIQSQTIILTQPKKKNIGKSANPMSSRNKSNVRIISQGVIRSLNLPRYYSSIILTSHNEELKTGDLSAGMAERCRVRFSKPDVTKKSSQVFRSRTDSKYLSYEGSHSSD